GQTPRGTGTRRAPIWSREMSERVTLRARSDHMALIEVGTRAPSFTLVYQHGGRHSLKNYRVRDVVLYFYPKDETPHCTIQACQFRDHHPDFSKIDVAVLGVSPDSAESHALFVDNHGLNFPLLADVKPDAQGHPAVCAAYGAWQEK